MIKGMPKGTKLGSMKPCKQCGKNFYVCQSELKKKYCGKDCYDKSPHITKGRKQTTEWVAKRMASHPTTKGKIPPNKGLRTGKMVKCTNCRKDIYKQNSSISKSKTGRLFCDRLCSNEYNKGENHARYNGAQDTSEKHKWIRKNSRKFKQWRKYVLTRDNHKCKLCGATDKLEIHHIIPFSACPEIVTLRMNGITLCHRCHKVTDSYGKNYTYNQRSMANSFCHIYYIPHNMQAYETVGNYEWTDKKVLIIFVSDTGNPDYNFLVTTHEIIEAYICEVRGIKEEEITKFDIMFEKERAEGKWTTEEPGFDSRCLYLREHTLATKIEKMLAKELQIDWNHYDNTINEL